MALIETQKRSFLLSKKTERDYSAVSQLIQSFSLNNDLSEVPRSFSSPEIEKPYKVLVASTRELRERAYKLIYQAYLEKGFVEKNKQEWLVDQHDTSTFTILIEDSEGQDAGCMTLVFDEDGDLPCENLFSEEIHQMKSKNSRLIEVSKICISDKHRMSRSLLVKMFNFIYIYAYHVRGYSDFVIEVNPRHCFFYKNLIGFEKVGEVKSCPRVAGAPASFMKLSIKSVEEKMNSSPLAKAKSREIFKSFFNHDQEKLLAEYFKENWSPMRREDRMYFGLDSKKEDLLLTLETDKNDRIQVAPLQQEAKPSAHKPSRSSTTWRLFEFGDLSFVPNLYHLYLRKYLVFFYKAFGYYKLWVPTFSEFIRKTKSKKIMDCCSGAGDPIQLIDTELNKDEFADIQFLLSDIQVHKEFVDKFNQSDNSRFHYIDKSVDVTKTSKDFSFPKAFINSFHHLSSEQVENVLKTNHDDGHEIIVMEYVRNSFLGYLSMMTGPLVTMLTLPFVVKAKHLPVMALFTYIIPAFPLMLFWDGVVSCKHEYSEKKLQKISKKLGLTFEIKRTISRSLMYPAGVSTITMTF